VLKTPFFDSYSLYTSFEVWKLPIGVKIESSLIIAIITENQILAKTNH
jgi:hypothetical protein